ncbi:hypothetical protein OG322_35375 [Streptomyces sp. NBC_01260]|uniref:hypothetical protein n=1 Tax=unclassified Streptomyces TaxID=2593676 RepID=UPI000F5511AD|nr:MULTISPECIES: hypothetical protein [unclassified Streptomyces]MCX4774509.1 hypothetical protein [Streptomyces sp. NBC_01285]ROQ72977.1 hypothetical protein EDD95_5595 [Streptomyces sp. CEV 2-1]RPK35136.1 hypothetical protein EES39_33145 [Streptomyces sp. ADI92-24]
MRWNTQRKLVKRVQATVPRRRHLVCRGLARCVYREPGHRTGRIDYSTTTEQEIEYTALFLGRHVENAQQQHQPRSAAT